jgi:hypothetical protein
MLRSEPVGMYSIKDSNTNLFVNNLFISTIQSGTTKYGAIKIFYCGKEIWKLFKVQEVPVAGNEEK